MEKPRAESRVQALSLVLMPVNSKGGFGPLASSLLDLTCNT